MSCGAGKTNFRLLDAYVGWDAADPATSNLTGFDDPGGIFLALTTPNATDPAQVLAYLPPDRLARGCGACEWYLAAPRACKSGLLWRDACHPQWQPAWPKHCAPELSNSAAAAAWRGLIAVSDQGANRVLIWGNRGQRLLAAISLDGPAALAFTPSGELLVTSSGSPRVARYGRDGLLRGFLRATPPGPVNRIAVDRKGRIWIVTGDQEDSWALWRAAPGNAEFQKVSAEELSGSFRPTGLVAASGLGFCLQENDSSGLALTSCFSWCGKPQDPGEVSFPQPPRRQPQGQLLTRVLDSGIPRCRWHRVRVDADVPAGTALAIAVATAEYAPIAILPAPQGATQDGNVVTLNTSLPHNRRAGDVVQIEGVLVAGYNQATVTVETVPTSTSLTYTLVAAGLAASGGGTVATLLQGDSSRDPVWSTFPAGQPHFKDWTGGPAGSLDFLVDQPPGRYLFFRLRLTGNGTDTPVVRRVRIDFPRVTSLEHIPAVYRENPKAEDFTERFLALFDASIAGADRVVERYPALLDAAGVPEQLLPWLGSFFDIGFDSTWDADKRRAILQGAPQLYRQRGTIAGLQLALKLVFGVSPAIEELSSTGTWGAIGSRKALQAARCDASGGQTVLHRNARLGAVRLFGKARSRFRLNSSPLCAAPLLSYGNPDLDPFAAGAFRFRLLLPPLADNSEQQRQRLMSLVEAQKPAHTVASLRVGGTGFILGRWSAVGIDTAFAPLAAPVLGSAGNVRLNRMSILWNGPRGREVGAAVGRNSVVGIQTIAG